MLGETTTTSDATGGVHFNSNDETADENSIGIAPKDDNDDLESDYSAFSCSREQVLQ